MKASRFRINWLMGCIALVALNFGVMRLLDGLGHRQAALNHSDRFLKVTQHWVVGGLPMLNTLGIVLVIGLRRRGSHRFVWGFVLFGAIALALYVAAVGLYFDEIEQAGHDLFRPIVAALANGQTVLSAGRFQMLICIVAVAFFLPQLAVALVSGFLFRFRLRVFVERRDHSPTDGPSSY
jgi:ABC-type Na+ efflux pump permease subunit